MKYRRKVTEVECEQFTDPSKPPHGVYEDHGSPLLFYVNTIHGDRTPIRLGDWVMPELDGEHFYPCGPAVFAAQWEPVTKSAGAEPTLIDLVLELREALGFDPAVPVSPMDAWEDALDEVRRFDRP